MFIRCYSPLPSRPSYFIASLFSEFLPLLSLACLAVMRRCSLRTSSCVAQGLRHEVSPNVMYSTLSLAGSSRNCSSDITTRTQFNAELSSCEILARTYCSQPPETPPASDPAAPPKPKKKPNYAAAKGIVNIYRKYLMQE